MIVKGGAEDVKLFIDKIMVLEVNRASLQYILDRRLIPPVSAFKSFPESPRAETKLLFKQLPRTAKFITVHL